jgi:hypothetical protein
MSTRTIVRGAVALAVLAGPAATASAMPADPVYTGAYSSAAPAAAEPVGGGNDSDGIDTTTVLVLAGGALLVGATGFQGGRVVARRRVFSQ